MIKVAIKLIWLDKIYVVVGKSRNSVSEMRMNSSLITLLSVS